MMMIMIMIIIIDRTGSVNTFKRHVSQYGLKMSIIKFASLWIKNYMSITICNIVKLFIIIAFNNTIRRNLSWCLKK